MKIFLMHEPFHTSNPSAEFYEAEYNQNNEKKYIQFS